MTEIVYITIAAALLRYSVGRTKFYSALKESARTEFPIRTKKWGARTLVEVLSADRWMNQLPEAFPAQGKEP